MIEYSGIWEHFGVKNGLPDMRIECVFEDSQGMLWIGTRAKGVVCYAGDEFTWSTTRDGLIGDEVFAIGQVTNGDVWIATNAGICTWTGERFSPVAGADGLSFLWGVGHAGGDDLWFSVERTPNTPARVCHWNGESFITVGLSSDATPGGRSIHAIAVDGRGRVWCGGHGLYVVEDGVADAHVIPGDEFGDVKAICAFEDKVIVATSSGTYALVDEKWDEIEGMGPLVESLHAGLDDGRVWAGLRDGRVLTLSQQGGVQPIGSVGVPLWRGLHRDRKGRVWAGSYGFGLFCYDELGFRRAGFDEGLPDNEVEAVALHDGRVWIGTPKGLISAEGTPLSNFCDIPEDYAIESVTGLLSDARGRLWIGKRNGRVFVLEGGRLRMCAKIESMFHYRIDTLVADGDGGVWVASSSGGGVARYASPETVECFEGEVPESYPGQIGAIAVGRMGEVAIGSRSPRAWNGIAEYRDGKFVQVQGIAGSPISALCYDSTGRLWVGTSEGVSICDTDFVLSYGMEDGLPSELITVLFEDDQGRMWIGTEGGGVCVYDGQVFQVFQFPGLPYCNTIRSITQGTGGEIWLGTKGGVIERCSCTAHVEVAIESVTADALYDRPTEVQFPDTVGRVTVTFRGRSDRDRSESLVYRYRLKGNQSDWQQCSGRQ